MMRDWNELYTRYLNRQCSPEEVRLLLAHFQVEGTDSMLQSRIEAALANKDIPAVDVPEVKAAFARIHQRLMDDVASDAVATTEKPRRSKSISPFKWLPYAAAVLLFLSIGIYWYHAGNKPETLLASKYGDDVLPGGNRATLTLADGSTIQLSEDHEGIIVGNELTYDDGTSLIDNGKLILDNDGRSERLSPTINYQLSTPKGGQYQVTLPDGTRVWLNAASTLRYPSRFDNEKRVVELTGEAYFQVSIRQNAVGNRVPFLVKTATQEVEVIGTQFNISAYDDEPNVKTTLVEGAVVIHTSISERTQASLQLAPGEQGVYHHGALTKTKVDVSAFIAWKSGLFSFDETELQTVMNQLSRWYDVSVVYQGDIPPTHYYGAINRSESLSKVLDLLKESGLNFKIENNTLIVLP